MVLFVTYSSAFGGAERLLVDFASGLESECAIACPPGPLEDAARRAGLRTFPLRRRDLRLRGDARVRAHALLELGGHARELRSLVRAIEPRVLVLWGMRSALASLAMRDLPPTAFQHNDFLPGRFTGALVRRAAARCRLITVPSQAVARDLGLRAEVIAPGVEPIAEDELPAAPPEVLVLGALATWKRPDLALEAFALLRRRHPDARLTVAGGPLPGEDPGFVEALHERAAQLDLRGVVSFAGEVAEPATELARCTCLLHCAEREPFGIAVAEALAAGRPAVVPDAAGPAEIVDESCGVRYAPGDASAAAEALDRVLGDPAEAAQMGAAGRERAAERFGLERQRARYHAALAPLIGEIGRASGLSGTDGSGQLTIITVTHNSAAFLPGFLASVRRHLPGVGVIVADSGSTDGTRGLAASQPEVTLLELGNIGFGAACNRALEHVHTPVAALLNPDVELIDDSLARLASEAGSGSPLRLLAPRVLNSDGSLQDTVHTRPLSPADLIGALVPPALIPGPAGARLAPWRAHGARRVGWAVGCALVARTETLRALGPFDERLFLYGEDMELGLRAARRGVETWLWPAARVIHHGGHAIVTTHGGEPFWLRARARHDALVLGRGPRAAALDDRVQALTFASRRWLKLALGRSAERERQQLLAVRSLHTSAWEGFARSDPQYYIDPELGPGRSIEEFREGGRGVVEWALQWAGGFSPHARALEIGSGLARNTVHLARHFAHVDGVDVSATMVSRAREFGLPGNVTLHALSGGDLHPLPDSSYALVFSHLVFQHVGSMSLIEAYLGEIARVLEPGGVAVLQFDTRPVSPLVAAGYKLPDPLLPRARHRGIRRVRRDPEAIRAAAARVGLALEDEQGAGSADHWLRWRRPSARAPGSGREIAQ